MKGERDVYLKNTESNKANGYYPRSLNTGSLKLNLQVPRDREGNFRPAVLPDRWKRSDSEYQSLLMSLIANGYSKSELRRVLGELGLSYSEDDIEEIRQALEEAVKDFKGRELEPDWLAIFIDAYEGGGQGGVSCAFNEEHTEEYGERGCVKICSGVKEGVEFRYDGKYVLQTSTELTPEEAVLAYKGLWQVERAFRELKFGLELRPVYHWNEERIRGHIMVCFLAFVLEVVLQKRLKECGCEESHRSLMIDLEQLKAVGLTVDGKSYLVRTDLQGRAYDVFKAVGIRLPSKVLEVR